MNWSKGVDARGQPIPTGEGNLESGWLPDQHPGGGGTNWPPPSFNPETGLFYVNARKGYSVAYLTDVEENPEGYGGIGGGLLTQGVLEAIDYKTGNVVWSHEYPSGSFGNSGPGILTTAGKLLFTGDPSGNLIAYDPATGRILWHFRTGSQVSNGPMTYELNGRQYLIVGAGDTLFAFAILRNDR